MSPLVNDALAVELGVAKGLHGFDADAAEWSTPADDPADPDTAQEGE
jgi:hypothetical protein